jgi:molybdenum cofactor cytidylyltransferase
LLAAGSSTRMGRSKVLLEIEGEAMVRRAAGEILAAGLDPAVVVVGHEADRVRGALGGLPCVVVMNPEHARGINASLSAGIGAVPPDVDSAVVALADMPFVTSSMLAALVARRRESGAPIVASRYGEVEAPPVLYARELFPELCGGVGEGRGREVVRRHRDRAVFVEWPADALADVDVPKDLDLVRQRPPDGITPGPQDPLVQAAAWRAAGRGVALATVVSTWGSSPRPAGSQLAVREDGSFVGSVSGGCIEGAVIQEALEIIRGGGTRLLEFGVSDEQAWSVGLACGGRVQVFVERVE